MATEISMMSSSDIISLIIKIKQSFIQISLSRSFHPLSHTQHTGDALSASGELAKLAFVVI